jgi:hypothetical protein
MKAVKVYAKPFLGDAYLGLNIRKIAEFEEGGGYANIE